MELFENSELKIKATIYGVAPVQAEGTINDFPFYFRARWDTWTFAISKNSNISPVDIQLPDQGKQYGFFAEGRLGNEREYRASYMDLDKVKEIITKSVSDYLKGLL